MINLVVVICFVCVGDYEGVFIGIVFCFDIVIDSEDVSRVVEIKKWWFEGGFSVEIMVVGEGFISV